MGARGCVRSFRSNACFSSEVEEECGGWERGALLLGPDLGCSQMSWSKALRLVSLRPSQMGSGREGRWDLPWGTIGPQDGRVSVRVIIFSFSP